MSSASCKWCKTQLPEILPANKRCPECYRPYDTAPVELMGRKFHPGFLQCHKGLKAALEAGEIEGMKFRVLDGEIESGDTYIAERNVGLQLLTCRDNNRDGGWINPTDSSKYPYDTGECIRIELVLD